MPRLTLNNLKKAGKVKYNSKISFKDVNRIKELFMRKKWEENTRHYFPTKEFFLFYIWKAYFRMIPRKSFLSLFDEIDNGKLSGSVRRIKVKNNKDVENIHHHIHGGIFGITIGAIVAGIAAAASKAAAAAATTAAVIGSSTAATTVATSVAGGIGGALAGAATEAIIKA